VLLAAVSMPALASELRLHSALCAGQWASWHSIQQKYASKQPVHLLDPTFAQLGLAQRALVDDSIKVPGSN
jgi:hypothetical protein